MTNATSDESGRHPEWEAFSRRQAGNPFLAHDPLYALSGPPIDAIKENIPNFFTADEERFERDLARTAGFGFFLHRPLGATAGVIGHEGGRTLAERQQATARQIDELLAGELRRSGADPEDVRAHFDQGTAHRQRIEDRQDAYAGWLLLNPEYRDEVRQFRGRWDAAVRAVGRFPRLPMGWMSDPTDGTPLPPGFRDECDRFYCRWGLEALATWDWPVPMEPDLNIGQRRDVDLFSSGGWCCSSRGTWSAATDWNCGRWSSGPASRPRITCSIG